jgi:hypothetical protein
MLAKMDPRLPAQETGAVPGISEEEWCSPPASGRACALHFSVTRTLMNLVSCPLALQLHHREFVLWMHLQETPVTAAHSVHKD